MELQGSYRFQAKQAARRSPQQAASESAAQLVGPLPTTGKGVGVAIIDSGVAPHPDLEASLTASLVCTPNGAYNQDLLGHGTHVAGIVAGRGSEVRGVAPDAKIISLQVVRGDEGAPKTPQENQQQQIESISSLLGALDWIVQNKDEYNIKVANLSVSLFPIIKKDESGAEYFVNPIGAAIKRCVEAGITLVTAAGNLGDRDNSVITYPAACPEVITVGALDTHGTVTTADDDLAPFSSRGPTFEGEIKPDLIAPGVSILSTNAANSQYDQGAQIRQQILAQAMAGGVESAQAVMTAVHSGFIEKDAFKQAKAQGMSLPEAVQASLKIYPTEGTQPGGSPAYIALDGTSQASPLVTGVVANMYEANPDLTPQQVKDILRSTAQPLPGLAPHQQGAGVFQPAAAVEAARALRKPSLEPRS
ncbi:MAG: S8 family serine peptidase [Vulcanimicrobiota bacterium]